MKFQELPGLKTISCLYYQTEGENFDLQCYVAMPGPILKYHNDGGVNLLNLFYIKDIREFIGTSHSDTQLEAQTIIVKLFKVSRLFSSLRRCCAGCQN
jgi:hypothetical protein